MINLLLKKYVCICLYLPVSSYEHLGVSSQAYTQLKNNLIKTYYNYGQRIISAGVAMATVSAWSRTETIYQRHKGMANALPCLFVANEIENKLKTEIQYLNFIKLFKDSWKKSVFNIRNRKL